MFNQFRTLGTRHTMDKKLEISCCVLSLIVFLLFTSSHRQILQGNKIKVFLWACENNSVDLDVGGSLGADPIANILRTL